LGWLAGPAGKDWQHSLRQSTVGAGIGGRIPIQIAGSVAWVPSEPVVVALAQRVERAEWAEGIVAIVAAGGGTIELVAAAAAAGEKQVPLGTGFVGVPCRNQMLYWLPSHPKPGWVQQLERVAAADGTWIGRIDHGAAGVGVAGMRASAQVQECSSAAALI